MFSAQQLNLETILATGAFVIIHVYKKVQCNQHVYHNSWADYGEVLSFGFKKYKL